MYPYDPQMTQMTQMVQVSQDKNDAETYAIIGAAMEVHRCLGPGFLEAVYHEALALELAAREIPLERQRELVIHYKGARLIAQYRADFVCMNSIIVELKAMRVLSGVDEAQIINYLKVSGLMRGLLLNFGSKQLQCRRFIHSRSEVSA